MGDYTGAIDAFEASLPFLEKIDSPVNLAVVLSYIGGAYHHLGRLQQALELYQRALAIVHNQRYSEGERKMLSNLGAVYKSLSQYQQALNYYQQALPLCVEIGEEPKKGTVLSNIGEIYEILKQYEQALNYYQQALAVWQKIGDLQEKAADLNNIGLVYSYQGQYSLALSFLQQALAIMQDFGDREGERIYLYNIASVYQCLEQYEQALDYYQQTLTICQEIGNREAEKTILRGIGAIYGHQRQHDQVLKSYQQLLAIVREMGDREGERIYLHNIASVSDCLEQYEQALDYYQQTLTICQEIGDREAQKTILGRIGAIYQQQGQYNQVLKFSEQLLAIVREMGDREAEGVALNVMAGSCLTLGQYEEGLKFLQQALAIAQENCARLVEGSTLTNIGQAHWRLGQYEQALDYHQQALTIFQDIRDGEGGEATALNNIGLIYDKLGQYKQALESYQQSLTILQKIGERSREAATLHNIGSVYRRLGQYEQSLELQQQSLAIVQEIGDQEGEGEALNGIGCFYESLGKYEQALTAFQQALTIGRTIGDRAGEGQRLTNIGDVYSKLGDNAQAIIFYKQAIEVKESIQGDIKIEELKTSFADEQINAYESLIRLLWNERRYEDAFNYVERSRARAFLDQLANGPINFHTGADTKLLQKEETLKAQITSLRTELANLLKQERSLQHQITGLRTTLFKLRSYPSNELDTEAIAQVQKQLSDREKEYTKLLTQLKLQGPEVASLVSVDVATLHQIRSLLDPDTTLVEYFVTEQATLAFVITRQGFGRVTLNFSQNDLTKKIDAFRRFPSLNHPHPKNLQQLHEWLITPLKPRLNTSHLAIVPHGVLHYLPFAALTDGQRYLCDDYTLVTLPSASVLRFLPSKCKPSTGKVLALGNPRTTEPLPTLHYAEQEVNTITQLYGTQPLVGTDATETAIFSQAASAEILHIAAHGKYNPHNPLFSTLYLAPDDQHDGRLEVHDIYELDLTSATNLVVLSACQTQLGELSKGDEVVGLNRAFLYAGTPSVMGSLWSVDDKVTGLLMERFYTHLRSGMAKAVALRQAQMDIRAEYAHPYYWAAFVLTGDGGSLNNWSLD